MKLRRGILIAALLLLLFVSLADFVHRGLLAPHTGLNDFQDPYVGSKLWLQHKNPYDLAAVRQTWQTASGYPAYNEVKTVYPLTTYLLVSPLSLLDWANANHLWNVLQLGSVFVIAWLIWRGELRNKSALSLLGALVLVLAYSPFHTGVKGGNVGQLCIALALAAFYFSTTRPIVSGVFLGLSICLKPQVAICFVLFFLMYRSWRVIAGTMVTGALLAAISLAPFLQQLPELKTSYRSNFTRGFANGASGDYTTTKSDRLSIVNLQPAIYQISHNKTDANLIAGAVFLIALVVWVFQVWTRSIPPTLALSALILISIVPLYHRTNDLGILVLPLAWAIANWHNAVRRYEVAVAVTAGTLYIPFAAILSRAETQLSPNIVASAWWRVFIAQSQSWIVLLLAALLLLAMSEWKEEKGVAAENHTVQVA